MGLNYTGYWEESKKILDSGFWIRIANPSSINGDIVHQFIGQCLIPLDHCIFSVLFCQTSLEAIVPPVMNTIFQYDDSANSYLYLAAAFEFIGRRGILFYYFQNKFLNLFSRIASKPIDIRWIRTGSQPYLKFMSSIVL